MITRADLARSLRQWQRAAGPYWMYVCATPFLQDVSTGPAPRQAGSTGWDIVEALARLGADRAYAVFVDRPPAETLRVAPNLNRLGYRIVPIIQRWCASPAVVRGDALVKALVEAGALVAPLDQPQGVVFVLDGDRLGPALEFKPRRPAIGAPALFDNRYEYPVDRFPPPAILVDDGITAAYWIGLDHVSPDLQVYAGRLAEAGLPPKLLDSEPG